MIGDYQTNRFEQFGERMFNFLVTFVPSHVFRQAWLRFFGAKIGRDSAIMRGTTIFGLTRLTIGNGCSVGFNVLLDARGGLTIDDAAVLASDVHIITGKHLVDSDDFGIQLRPVHIGHHAWVASRATLLQDITIGDGAVVAACSMVNSDVDAMAIVAGTPAKVVGKRQSTLEYYPKFRPLLY